MRMETGIAFMPQASGLSFGFGKIGGEKWSVPLKFSFHRNSEFKKIGLLYRRSNVDLKGFSLCKKTEEGMYVQDLCCQLPNMSIER